MTAPASVPFDAAPLVEPVDRAAVREFSRSLRAQGRIPATFSGQNVVGIIVAVIVGAVFLFVFSSVVPILLGAFLSEGPASFAIGAGAFLPLLLFGTVLALVIVFVVRGQLGARTRWYRLDRFATANAMTFLPQIPNPALPGMIFGIGNSRMARDAVRGAAPRFVEFANYRYETGSGKNRTTHHWGYVAIRLDTPLPHIVLDAQSNNGLFGSNLPASFDRDQRLSLEGDFDRYFALYCPEGYERDALYLFTPDIMARFIDNAAALDIEIVDDWMFLYAKRDFVTLDPATWGWLFTTVAALIDKVDRWARWRDERLASAVTDAAGTARGGADAGGAASFAPLRPPPGVAPQGRRLSRAFPWGTAIVFGFLLLWWILSNTGVLGMLLPGW